MLLVQRFLTSSYPMGYIGTEKEKLCARSYEFRNPRFSIISLIGGVSIDLYFPVIYGIE